MPKTIDASTSEWVALVPALGIGIYLALGFAGVFKSCTPAQETSVPQELNTDHGVTSTPWDCPEPSRALLPAAASTPHGEALPKGGLDANTVPTIHLAAIAARADAPLQLTSSNNEAMAKAITLRPAC